MNLPIFLYLAMMPEPGDDRPMPGEWRTCRACDGSGMSMRRWRFQRGAWIATEQAKAVCASCGGLGKVPVQ